MYGTFNFFLAFLFCFVCLFEFEMEDLVCFYWFFDSLTYFCVSIGSRQSMLCISLRFVVLRLSVVKARILNTLTSSVHLPGEALVLVVGISWAVL